MNEIAENLRRAAQHHLWDGVNPDAEYQHVYSCNAVLRADGVEHGSLTLGFLVGLGLSSRDDPQFEEFKEGKARQGARFSWLMFAADIAEEWDIK